MLSTIMLRKRESYSGDGLSDGCEHGGAERVHEDLVFVQHVQQDCHHVLRPQVLQHLDKRRTTEMYRSIIDKQHTTEMYRSIIDKRRTTEMYSSGTIMWEFIFYFWF